MMTTAAIIMTNKKMMIMKPTARHLIKQACSVSHAAYASTLVKIPTTITLIPPPPPTATTTNPHPLPPTSTPEHKSLSYPLDDM